MAYIEACLASHHPIEEVGYRLVGHELYQLEVVNTMESSFEVASLGLHQMVHFDHPLLGTHYMLEGSCSARQGHFHHLGILLKEEIMEDILLLLVLLHLLELLLVEGIHLNHHLDLDCTEELPQLVPRILVEHFPHQKDLKDP